MKRQQQSTIPFIESNIIWEEHYGVIYKITNTVNDKLYIGQSVQFDERLNEHVRSTVYEKDKAYNYPLYRAMRKYGINKFTIEIIDLAENQDMLDQLEIEYIARFDTIIDHDHGYNQTYGGRGGKHSEETKKKLSGENNYNFGKTGGLSASAIKVINLDTGKIYPSMTDCAIEEYGDKKYVKNISRVCDPNSDRYRFQGVRYACIDENNNPIPKAREQIITSVRIKDINTGQIFESQVECAIKLFGDKRFSTAISDVSNPNCKLKSFRGHTFIRI